MCRPAAHENHGCPSFRTVVGAFGTARFDDWVRNGLRTSEPHRPIGYFLTFFLAIATYVWMFGISEFNFSA